VAFILDDIVDEIITLAVDYSTSWFGRDKFIYENTLSLPLPINISSYCPFLPVDT
jgi:hypothetical protein